MRTRGTKGKDINPNAVDSTTGYDVNGNDFVANSDFIVRYTFHSYSATQSFTDTSFTNNKSYFQHILQWDQMFPSEVQSAIMTQMVVNPGSGETVDVRLRNLNDTEVVHSQTGVDSRGVVTMGPTNYTPTTTDDEIDIRLEWKADSGMSSSDILTARMAAGIQL